VTTTDRSTDGPIDLVTGAFGNAGAAIADILVARGRNVRTLTSRRPDSSEHNIDRRPFEWDDPDAMAESFSGVDTFYNTYWMRMGDGGSYDLAVERCGKLITAAEQAGVKRFVHISVAHPSKTSPYPYFRGKARVEQRLRDSPLPATTVRPTLIFGGDSVLVNNLAWVLRRLPVLAVPGTGRYRVRPVHVDDIARTCVEAASRPASSPAASSSSPATSSVGALEVIDAVGPDRPTYAEMVRMVRRAVGGRALVVGAPTPVVLAGSALLGKLLRDDVVNRAELLSTVDGLADTDGPSTGTTSFAAWLDEHASTLGHRYVNERSGRG